MPFIPAAELRGIQNNKLRRKRSSLGRDLIFKIGCSLSEGDAVQIIGDKQLSVF